MSHPEGRRVASPLLPAEPSGQRVGQRCGRSSFPQGKAAMPAEPDYKRRYGWRGPGCVRASRGSVYMAAARKSQAGPAAAPPPRTPSLRRPAGVARSAARARPAECRLRCCALPLTRSVLGQETRLAAVPETAKPNREEWPQKRPDRVRVGLAEEE